MSQVAAALEITKDRFMILMREGQLMIHKKGVVSCQYFSMHKDMLNKRELENLNQFIKKLKSDGRPVDNRDLPIEIHVVDKGNISNVQSHSIK